MGHRIVIGMSDVLSEMCRHAGKWGMYINHSNSSAGIGPYELARAAPFFTKDEAEKFWHYEKAIMLFDSEEELLSYFRQVKGEDGPREENPYDGPANVYAITCAPDGTLMDVNT